jgi:hypothetical protein
MGEDNPPAPYRCPSDCSNKPEKPPFNKVETPAVVTGSGPVGEKNEVSPALPPHGCTTTGTAARYSGSPLRRKVASRIIMPGVGAVGHSMDWVNAPAIASQTGHTASSCPKSDSRRRRTWPSSGSQSTTLPCPPPLQGLGLKLKSKADLSGAEATATVWQLLGRSGQYRRRATVQSKMNGLGLFCW